MEPTDEECEWHSDREEEEELAVSTPLVFVSTELNALLILVFHSKIRESFAITT